MAKFIAILFATLFLSNALANEVSSVYGKIRKSEKTLHGLTSPYFVTFEHQGKLLAYPIDTKSKAMAEKIKSFVDKDALIVGDVKKVKFKADGLEYVVETFIPRSIEPLKLSALGEAVWIEPQQKEVPKKTQKKESDLILGSHDPHEGKLAPRRVNIKTVVGTRINDQVANTLIFTGAAAIIGTQLFKKK